MYTASYRPDHGPRRSRSRFKLKAVGVTILLLIAAGGFFAYSQFIPTAVERAVNQLQFDDSVTDAEKQTIRDAITNQNKTFDGSVQVSVKTTLKPQSSATVLAAYVPVTKLYATRQLITKDDLSRLSVHVADGGDTIRAAVARALDLETDKLLTLTDAPEELKDSEVAFIPADQLSYKVKLLNFNDGYYLDTFQSGAIFRQAEFTGNAAQSLSDLKLNSLRSKDTTLKVNMTGVTALTRLMMRKLNRVGDPKYFSEKIGAFLADADITHVSNEVSFKTGCTYSDTVFCSPPEMIDILKDSGIDLVELTGNHNNDSGKQFNTESIELYNSLKMHTFGGGLNSTEAEKPYVADQKGSKVTFLGYNYPDSPDGGPIATASTPGANSFDFDKIKKDIDAAKQQSSFVIVDVQFWECYAYPAGYVEFPECDQPINNQKEVFRRIAGLGADMVIGTQAHQPQTYEVYSDTPIYYGLGNLYFEQTQWPGTERGIILTHYFVGSKLIQTKLSPTRYDRDFQTHLMKDGDAVELLDRLKTARTAANL